MQPQNIFKFQTWNWNVIMVIKSHSKPDLISNAPFCLFVTVNHNVRLYMPQINYITLKLPSSPILSEPHRVSPTLFCNSTSPPSPNCTKDFCNCMHTLNVRKDSLVEIILVDKGG